MSISAEIDSRNPEPVVPRYDQYAHVSFTEMDGPDLVLNAWRMHARGYRDMGFVTDDAIIKDGPMAGCLPGDIDKSRGVNVQYHLAVDRDGRDVATMRKRYVGPDETYQVLPAYQLSEGHLSPEGQALLEELSTTHTIVEIAALARPADSHPMSVHEVIRKNIQDVIGKNEVWLFSMVSSTYDNLAQNSFGPRNLQQIGEDIPLNDPRVSPNIELRPGVLYPDQFMGNLLTSYYEADTNLERARLKRSFLFYTEGLRPSQMTAEVALARTEMLQEKAAKIGVQEARVTGAATEAGALMTDLVQNQPGRAYRRNMRAAISAAASMATLGFYRKGL